MDAVLGALLLLIGLALGLALASKQLALLKDQLSFTDRVAHDFYLEVQHLRRVNRFLRRDSDYDAGDWWKNPNDEGGEDET